MRQFFTASVAAAIFLGTSVSAAPGDISAADFLAKAEKLKRKGAMAPFSSEFKVVKAQIEGARDAYRARIDADKAAGRKPHSCPPPKGKGKMTSEELLTHLRSYPEARRKSITLKVAMADLMKQRYPCK